ncbi:MAG: competence/damage-inducible protein A [Bacteroidales bacterium]|jgi:nicotinamide-nucleotide amidase|nr:competence/damage-inducible protein A [Bacteroidales bacterium]
MKAEIITIGDELLIGQVIDSNSAYIARELNKIGISVYQITSVSDDGEHIHTALDDASKRVRLVLITGGLGPTKDDITKAALARYAGVRLVTDGGTLRHIESIMASRHIAMNPLNKKQAEVLENCIVIPNTCGTAPGMWFEKEGIVYISMPGVPFEMKTMMQDELIPRLRQYFETDVILHRTLLVSGIPESSLALLIEQWEDHLPPYMKLAYLPSGGMIRLRLSTSGTDKAFIEREVEEAIEKLRPILGKHLLSVQDELPEELVGRLLSERGETVSTAESCTGGNIAHMLTTVSGSSQYFKGSVVAYANEVKVSLLGVVASDIEQYGAVSKIVVEQMAQNVRKLLDTDYAVATSGIAGPTGGTVEKPVGTIWVALATKSRVISKLLHFGNNRENNIQRTTTAALNMLIEQLRGD